MNAVKISMMITSANSVRRIKWVIFLVFKCFLNRFWKQMSRLSQNAKVLKCCAPEAFSGAKLQVLMENSNRKWVGKG